MHQSVFIRARVSAAGRSDLNNVIFMHGGFAHVSAVLNRRPMGRKFRAVRVRITSSIEQIAVAVRACQATQGVPACVLPTSGEFQNAGMDRVNRWIVKAGGWAPVRTMPV